MIHQSLERPTIRGASVAGLVSVLTSRAQRVRGRSRIRRPRGADVLGRRLREQTTEVEA